MNFAKNILLAFGVISLSDKASAACTPVKSITCTLVSEAPVLDGATDDWSNVEVIEAPLTHALVPSQSYPLGNGTVKIRCVHDAERVYFLFEVPGIYRFSTEDNKKCASISTMFKMGEDATLYNMGGCPLAPGGDCEASPEGCDSYKVDLGGHWELKTTEMSTLYGVNEGTGNDEAANKDDEYSVNPYCRFDDDDEKAANEWEGAWLHSSPTKIERAATDAMTMNNDGSYVFEMARSLQTASAETDAQLEKGKAVDFGFAFWDPLESEENGWTDAGHYVTGCSNDWISLRLVDEKGEITEEGLDIDYAGSVEEGKSAAFSTGGSVIYGLVSTFAFAHALKNIIA